MSALSISQPHSIVHPPNGTEPATYQPPFDVELERLVLSTTLGDAEFYEKVFEQSLIETEDFHDLRHRQIFNAMRELWAAGSHADPYLLRDSLLRIGWTEKETMEIFDLQNLFVSALFGSQHIALLKKLTRRRQFEQFATEALTQDDPFGYLEQKTGELQPIAGAQDEDVADDANPLKVAPPAQPLQLGWIDEYALLMTRLTGSPFEFNRLCGLVTAAAAIQRRAYVPMGFGDIFPNIYATIIARSSVFHKSSSLNKPRDLLRRAQLERLILSEMATSEGLLRQLSEQGNGVIIRDEIGTLFSAHNTKYLQQLKPDLTALYDCYPYSRQLSNDSVKVQTPYLSILGATTPARFYDSVTYTDWQDGFLARWLFVMPEGEPDFSSVGIYMPDHDAAITRLAWKLAEIDRHPVTAFVFDDGAFALWDAWRLIGVKEAYAYDDDVFSAIDSRYSTYALKFALILTAVNGTWGTISQETMQTAIGLADNYKGYTNKLLAERSRFGISGAKLQRVFKFILRNPTGRTARQIQQGTRLKADDTRLCLEKLSEIGAIMDGINGRATVYVAVTDKLPIKSWK